MIWLDVGLNWLHWIDSFWFGFTKCGSIGCHSICFYLVGFTCRVSLAWASDCFRVPGLTWFWFCSTRQTSWIFVDAAALVDSYVILLPTHVSSSYCILHVRLYAYMHTYICIYIYIYRDAMHTRLMWIKMNIHIYMSPGRGKARARGFCPPPPPLHRACICNSVCIHM